MKLGDSDMVALLAVLLTIAIFFLIGFFLYQAFQLCDCMAQNGDALYCISYTIRN